MCRRWDSWRSRRSASSALQPSACISTPLAWSTTERATTASFSWLAVRWAWPKAVALVSIALPKAASVSAIGLDWTSSTPGRTPNRDRTRAPRGNSRTRWTEQRTLRRSASAAYSGQRVSASVSGQLTGRPSAAASMSGPRPRSSWRSASSARSGWVAAAPITSPSRQTAAWAPAQAGTCQAASSASRFSDRASEPLVRLSSSAASYPRCSIGNGPPSWLGLAGGGRSRRRRFGLRGRTRRLAGPGDEADGRDPGGAGGQARAGGGRLLNGHLAPGPGDPGRSATRRVAGLTGGHAVRPAAEQRADGDHREHDGDQHKGVYGGTRPQPPEPLARPGPRQRLRTDRFVCVDPGKYGEHRNELRL